jgi:hypothetical protein
MRPTLQTVPENCTATANQTSAGATVVPTTPNGNREPATTAAAAAVTTVVEKTTPASNHSTVTQEKTVVHPPQPQQLQAVKPRNSSRVSLFVLQFSLSLLFRSVPLFSVVSHPVQSSKKNIRSFDIATRLS